MHGFESALRSRGLDVKPGMVVEGAHTDSTGCEAMRRLLESGLRPDGVVCYNDPVAAGAMKAILNAGLRIPQDIAVIGAGNVHYSDLLRVSLTTVDQNTPGIGEKAARILLDLLSTRRGAKLQVITLAPRVIVRDSTVAR
jgi:LacI family transcriptional regulator